MEDEIKIAYPKADVVSVPAMGGMFDVEVEGKKIFSKNEADRFPRPGEVVDLMKLEGF